MLTFVRVVSIGIGLSAVCACGRSTPAEHVRRAEEYAAKKDFANAIVE